MSHFVLVNIRLFREDLLEYRLMALKEGKSFSTYIRDILRTYTHHKKQATASQASQK
jgi:predicted DNA binding CopG/RHH family protein